MADQPATGATAEVVIRLTTQLPDSALHVPNDTMMVPSDLTRYALSELVNKLLERDTPLPFDFLMPGTQTGPPAMEVEGESAEAKELKSLEQKVFLRTSLASYVRAHKVSSESVLEIVYTLATPPMQTAELESGEDWLAGVAVFPGATAGAQQVVAASCDGALRAFSVEAAAALGELALQACTPVARRGLTQLLGLSTPSAGSNGVVVGSKDGKVRVGDVSAADGSFTELLATPAVKSSGVYSTVEAIAVSRKQELLAASGAGGAGAAVGISVFNLAEGLAKGRKHAAALKGAGKPKKRKRGEEESESLPLEPEFTIATKHSDGVSALAFASETLLLSGSRDATVRAFDLVSNREVGHVSVGKSVAAMSFNAALALLAVAHEDGKLSFWDVAAAGGADAEPKVGFALSAKFEPMRAHGGMVSSCAWRGAGAEGEANGNFQLVTTGLDGKLKLLDVRSAGMPLQAFDVAGGAEAAREGGDADAASVRLLCSAVGAAAGGNNFFVSGASDGKVRAHLVGGSVAE